MTADWISSVSYPTLILRANLLRDIRAFFAARKVLEVTTPTLGGTGVSDVHLVNLTCQLRNSIGFLQTSPEYAMKRLLAGGSGPIYQVCPAFRGGEHGQRHHVEFSMLEWYRPGFSLDELIDEVEALLVAICHGLSGLRRVTYQQLFESSCGVNPHRASIADLQGVISDRGIDAQHLSSDKATQSDYLDLLFSTLVEPELDGVIVKDYPACQAALAVIDEDDAGDCVARRFECFLQGMELANGYDELRDSDELRLRFTRNNQMRASRGLPEIALDERLLAAIPEMPPCSGVALGVDRLLMIISGKRDLSEVINFTRDYA